MSDGPTFGSLFSGIGGIDLGLERAGWRCSWQVEIDPWCRSVLERHWPAVPRWDDTTTFEPTASDRVDLIAGGFPCQPVSQAGRRLGTADERWLWPAFARIVRVLRPRFVLVENVPGLLARGMGDVLGDLAASGYDAEWDCIPAVAVGAPHLRYRVFVVAYASGEGLEGRGLRGPVAERGRETSGWRTFGRPERSDWWATEPNVGRVAHGIPSRVDRLRGLGNAVVPQIPEIIGRWIREAFDL